MPIITFLLENLYHHRYMENAWFRRKAYGYRPISWQGWVLLLIHFAIVLFFFNKAGSESHSASDTLINFSPKFMLSSLAFVLIARANSEKF